MKISNFIKLVFVLFVFVFSSCEQENKNVVENNNEITIGLYGEPDMMNPYFSNSGYTSDVVKHIYGTLINFDPFTNEIKPVLVKKTAKKTDNQKGIDFEYEIYDEAVWDDGSPITANDYIFTVKAILNPYVELAGIRNYLTIISSIKVDFNNPKKFIISTNEKHILAEEISGGFEILPKYLFDENHIMDGFSLEELRTMDIDKLEQDKKDALQKFATEFSSTKYKNDPKYTRGSGAYYLSEWLPGQKIVLVKKDNWWGDKLAEKNEMLRNYPKKLIFKPFADPQTAITSIKNGDLDILTSIPETTFSKMKEDSKYKDKFYFLTPKIPKNSIIVLNERNTILSDKNVRKAIANLIDVDLIIENLLFGYGERIIGPISSSKVYYNSDLKPIPYDLDNAKKLLDESGWKDTNNDGIRDKIINNELVPLQLSLNIASSSSTGKGIAQILKENAKEIGLEINIEVLDTKKHVNKVKGKSFEIAMISKRDSPSLYNPTGWHTSQSGPKGGNYSGFGNEESDKIIEEILSTNDSERRNLLYKKLQELIYNDQPIIYLYLSYSPTLISKKLRNVKTCSLKPGYIERLYQ